MIDIDIYASFDVRSDYEVLEEGVRDDPIVISVPDNFPDNFYDADNFSKLTAALFSKTDFLEEIGMFFEDYLDLENSQYSVHLGISEIVIHADKEISLDYNDDDSNFKDSLLKLENGFFNPINI